MESVSELPGYFICGEADCMNGYGVKIMMADDDVLSQDVTSAHSNMTILPGEPEDSSLHRSVQCFEFLALAYTVRLPWLLIYGPLEHT